MADYMRECLTNSEWGYYMKKDVFGAKGDFTTSPEISQVFGELVGVWLVNEWLTRGSPKPFHIVEFGPGRGTLMADILRVFSKFPEIKQNTLLHFIEASDFLREKQEKTIAEFGISADWSSRWNECSLHSNNSSSSSHPNETTCFLAHEFFDALPIHVFQRRQDKWREVLVNVNERGQFQLSLCQTDTPASVAYLPRVADIIPPLCNHIEVCPEALLLGESIAQYCLASAAPHFGLVIDFGHTGEMHRFDSIRAFKKHRICDPLSDPGNCDLTADVNFTMLMNAMKSSDPQHNLQMHGPVSQTQFLFQMGLETRLQVLLQHNKDPQQQKELISGCRKLVDPKEMGSRFKFLTFRRRCDNLLESHVPAGFVEHTPSAHSADKVKDK